MSAQTRDVQFDEGLLETEPRLALHGHEGGNHEYRKGQSLRATAVPT